MLEGAKRLQMRGASWRRRACPAKGRAPRAC